MEHVTFQTIDYIVFFSYMAGILAFGLFLAFYRKQETARDYFLAGDRLPWYAIGASVLASNISTEHFIGMMGWAYVYGFVIANFEWGAWFTWSIALWFFLPFYLRTRIFTVPEFVELRFSRSVRTLLSLASLTTYLTALMAGVLFAGAKVLNAMLGIPLHWGVLALGVATGVYCIFGGLLAVVWTDFVQCILFIVGGGLVTWLGLKRVGGLGNLMTEMPEQFFMFHVQHEQAPIIAFYLCSFFVGAYYMSSNQFMMQRCMGGRSHWDGAMGLVFSNFLKLLMPLIVVLPGIVAARMFPNLPDPDQSYPIMVAELLGPGLLGLLMSGLAAAMMSTVSSALNSASTLFTLDIYAPLAKLDENDPRLVRMGKWVTTGLLVLGMALGMFYSRLTDPVTGAPMPVFGIIMNIFFFIGPPLSIVFLAGIFWPRATPKAAVWTIIMGYVGGLVSELVIFKPYDRMFAPLRAFFFPTDSLVNFKLWFDGTAFAATFRNFLYFAIWIGMISLIVMVVVSLLTKPRKREEIAHLLWRPSVMKVDSKPGERTTRSLVFWWAVVMALTAILYGYFAWFQLSHS
ncbi:MAG TPA: sodium/solute symporter [Candidatus Sumerlaeota bacterium]|nr:sodium/solute symporter [Candidatus Sumerlaeota bacterium]